MKNLSHEETKKKFNLGFLDLLQGNPIGGTWGLPEIVCRTRTFPDYIALYSHPGDYAHTPNTAVSFAEFDNVIDGPNGIYQAIHYGQKKLLEKFRERFRDAAYIITPDYSQFVDAPPWLNAENLAHGRIVGLWFQRVLRKVVIPLVTFPRSNFSTPFFLA